MNYGGWISKSLYLENVTGNEIIKEQETINISDNMKVVATTILKGDNIEGKQRFHAWIYYQIKAEKIQEIKINI